MSSLAHESFVMTSNTSPTGTSAISFLKTIGLRQLAPEIFTDLKTTLSHGGEVKRLITQAAEKG